MKGDCGRLIGLVTLSSSSSSLTILLRPCTLDAGSKREVHVVPALTMFALKILIISSTTGDLLLDRPLPASSTNAAFQYDVGTAYWLTWGGLYQVSVRCPGFLALSNRGVLDNLEFCFYHHSSCGWGDTSSFFTGLWNGGVAGSETMMDHTSVTAAHHAAIHMYYTPPMEVEADL